MPPSLSQVTGTDVVIRARGVEKTFGHVHALRGPRPRSPPRRVPRAHRRQRRRKSTLRGPSPESSRSDARAGWRSKARGSSARAARALLPNSESRPSTKRLRSGPISRSPTTCSSAGRSSAAAYSACSTASGWPRARRRHWHALAGMALVRARQFESSLAGNSRPSPWREPSTGRSRRSSWTSRQPRSRHGKCREPTRTSAPAAAKGLGVLVITHDIPNMLTYAHRISSCDAVGSSRTPGERDTVAELVELMVGRDSDELQPPPAEAA